MKSFVFYTIAICVKLMIFQMVDAGLEPHLPVSEECRNQPCLNKTL